METIKVSLKDGSVREYPVGTTIGQVAESISRGLASKALVGKFNEQIKDLSHPLMEDGQLDILTFDQEEGRGLYILTRSSAANFDINMHSGAGRIGRMIIRPMSLYEVGASSGAVSLKE